MSAQSDKAADAAMVEIWKDWFNFYHKHFRGPGIAISMADQMCFYEIAQPKLRQLADDGQ